MFCVLVVSGRIHLIRLAGVPKRDFYLTFN